MITSTDIKNIAAALVSFHKEVGKIGKDSNNPFFKSKYASLSNILDGISAPLVNNGLSVVQFPEGDNMLTTRLVHVSGEWMEATYQMKPLKDTPQDRGSAITYQRRYAIGAVLSLNIDEDDDGNAASKPQVKKPTGNEKNDTQSPPVTAYNHAPVGNGKQTITNAAFKKALDRIDAGEVDLIAKIESSYGLDEAQTNLLNERKEKYSQPKNN